MTLPPLSSSVPLEVELIGRIYGEVVSTRGATSLGVGWSTTLAQQLRLAVLTDLLEGDTPSQPVSVHDLGCGWGALWGLLRDRPQPGIARYTGYDIAPEMIATARRTFPPAQPTDQRARFVVSSHALEPADYGFVSGTYNFRDQAPLAVWEPYVRQSLTHFMGQCRRGLAFNLLHIRKKSARPMYYADPAAWLDWAQAQAAPRGGSVTLRDDYLEDDFTLFIRFPG